MAKKKLYLIDGYGFVFRAYHSLPPLTNPEGTPVGAVYGFTNMITKILAEHKPDYMAMVLDAGKDTFRNEIYSEYKANRPPAPDDLIPQFPLIRDASEALGLQPLDKVGYEADDIIATLTARAKADDMEVTIISSDKDLMQLVDDDAGVMMYDAMRNRQVRAEQVVEKFNVSPDKVLDVLSLMGDSSDNVPGVPGIGPKTASELINTYGDLETLLERAEEIKQNKRRESLIEFADQARLSKELITLHYEVPIEINYDDLVVDADDKKHLLAFAQKHSFKSIVSKLEKELDALGMELPPVESYEDEPAPEQPKVEMNISLIENESSLNEFITQTEKQNYLGVYFLDDVGIGLSFKSGEAFFVKFMEGSGDDLFSQNKLSKDSVIQKLKNIFENPEILKITHNIKASGHNNLRPFEDLMVLSYAINTGLKSGELHDIDPTLPTLEDLCGKGAKKKTLQEIEPQDLAEYACEISHSLMQNHAHLRQELFNKRQVNIYERIEKPLISSIKKMEDRGVKIDPKILQDMSADFEQKLAELESQIHKLAGHEFNIASPAQLGEVLFDEMGLPHGKKSKKTGQYSTSAQILQDLAIEGHEIAEKVLDYRQLSKLKSTYTDALQKDINSQTGRVHSTFLMTSTNTGRLSSKNPNLQNIPIRTEDGRKIRNAFVAEPGNKLISADYSQIELRLLAHVGKIEPLIEAFKNGQDIHAVTAHQVFGVPLEQVDDEHRRKAKTINFGIIYGLSAHGLSERLKIPRDESKRYIEQYFEQYPGIKQYMDNTIHACHEQGYVETITGRKCYISGINDKNYQIRSFSERAAINAPLQGSAADIIKKAMLDLDKAKLPMLLQVHDELIFEVPEAEAEQVTQRIKKIMQSAEKLSVPLVVDSNSGNNWGEIH